MTLRTVFIINPKSGTPKYISRLHYLIRKHLGRNNRNISIYKSRRPEQVYEIASRVAADGCDMVVAVGGDGTVNEAARGLVNTDTALGVLPSGSGNGYAKNMGLPFRLEPALEVIKNPRFRRIDVGQVHDQIFLVSCGIGWEAIIATLFEGSRLRGILPYAHATITTFSQYEPQEIEIYSEPGNWEYHGRPMLFSIANMKEFGVGITIAPDALDDDGLLDICLIPRHSLLNVLKYAPEMFRKNTAEIPGYIRRSAVKINIRRPYPGNIHVDGTPKPAGNEIDIKILPSALKVAVKQSG